MTSRFFSAILRLIVRKERKKLLLTRLRCKEGICMEHLRSTELLRHRFFTFFCIEEHDNTISFGRNSSSDHREAGEDYNLHTTLSIKG